MSKVEWQTTHNRKSNRQVGQAAAEAIACGGGKEQMQEEARSGMNQRN